MDGLLVVDKPVGPTSHDVVAVARRVLGERRIGHTGTLDPAASGVLPLVLGKATRLARFVSAADKTYRASITIGLSTDSYDAEGRPVGEPYKGPLPAASVIVPVIETFRGTFPQQPPVFSARKVAGRRSHRIARAARRAGGVAAEDTAPALEPTMVTVHRIELLRVEDASIELELTCSSGFYVRSLAHDLGQRLRTGAHLTSLRRTRSGALGLERCVSLEELSDGRRTNDVLFPLDEMLPEMPALALNEAGTEHARHGRSLGAGDLQDAGALSAFAVGGEDRCRLIGARGHLIGVAAIKAPGALHPFVVLM